ncbi:hypothetical protein [Dolichospermum planctonicum]
MITHIINHANPKTIC